MMHLKLYEEFNDQRWYNGAQLKINQYNLDHINKDNKDEEGPGIYLTTDKDDAQKYGSYINIITLDKEANLIDPEEREITEEEMEQASRLIKENVDDWEGKAQNWSEDPESGLYGFLSDAMQKASNPIDFWQTVWYDFFRHNPKRYMNGMVNIGYDGFIVKAYHGHGHGESDHAIIYNPDIIEIINQEKV